MGKLEQQKLYRAKTNNESTKRYEKTKKGFAMRLYRNMKSRISGVQKKNLERYIGKEILEKQVFYKWILSNSDFDLLFNQYEASGYQRKFAPSVDRIDPNFGYSINNIQIITMSENSGKDAKKKIAKYTKDMVFVEQFNSINEAAQIAGVSPCSITTAASDKYASSKTAGGFIWKYVTMETTT